VVEVEVAVAVAVAVVWQGAAKVFALDEHAKTTTTTNRPSTCACHE